MASNTNNPKTPSSPPRPLFPDGYQIWNSRNTFRAGPQHASPVTPSRTRPKSTRHAIATRWKNFTKAASRIATPRQAKDVEQPAIDPYRQRITERVWADDDAKYQQQMVKSRRPLPLPVPSSSTSLDVNPSSSIANNSLSSVEVSSSFVIRRKPVPNRIPNPANRNRNTPSVMVTPSTPSPHYSMETNPPSPANENYENYSSPTRITYGRVRSSHPRVEHAPPIMEPMCASFETASIDSAETDSASAPDDASPSIPVVSSSNPAIEPANTEVRRARQRAVQTPDAPPPVTTPATALAREDARRVTLYLSDSEVELYKQAITRI